MFNISTYSKYNPTESFVHKLNPVVKIICVLSMIITIFCIYDPFSYVVLSGITILIMLLSNVKLKNYFTVLKTFRWLILIFGIIGSLTYFTNYDLEISIYSAIYSMLNTIFVIIYLMLFIYTTSFTDIIYGFNFILSPLNYIKVSSKKVALNIAFIFRYISLYVEEKNRVIKAEAVRGLDYVTSPYSKPISISLKNKIKNIKNLMDIKLFAFKENTTNLKIEKLNLSDLIVVGIYVIMLLIIVSWRYR